MRSEKFQTGNNDSSSATTAQIKTIAMRFIFMPNDEHVHHYQRERASITGLRL
jgi:hypothetical protein